MKMKLDTLKPNRWRDLSIDPINKDAVARLKKSIEDHGFWGGVVVDEKTREIACGHHRVEAAKEAGITFADLVVRELSDEEMIRIYHDETQRGADSGSRTGAVAAALRYTMRALLLGEGEMSKKVRGNALKRLEKGEIGREMLHKLFPSLSDATLKVEVENLKAAGIYARIFEKVAEELKDVLPAQPVRSPGSKTGSNIPKNEAKSTKSLRLGKERRENPLGVAEKAVENTSKKYKRVFDLEGVSEYLEKVAHIDAFRKAVLAGGETRPIPIEKQAKLAKEIVEKISIPTAKAITRYVDGVRYREEGKRSQELRAYARVVASNLVERYDGNAEVAREVAKRLVDEGIRISNVFQSDELDRMVVEELEVRAPYALWGAR